jgi:hypothetical protein
MAKGIILLGSTYNNLTVRALSEKTGSNGGAIYYCQCICGEHKYVRKDYLGKVKGCGCIRSGYKAKKVIKKKASAAIREITKSAAKVRIAVKKVEKARTHEYNPICRQRIEDIKTQREIDKQFSY